MKVNREQIESRARKGDLREELSGKLAPYLLGGELGASQRTQLAAPGTVLVLVSNLPPTACPALPQGYLFPVRWCEGQVDDGKLPPQLLVTARQVRQVLRVDGWRLQRLEIHTAFDFSEFVVEGGSAFLPLAAGLLVAQRGGRPDPAVFATGAWDAASQCLLPVEFGGKGVAIQASGLTATSVFAPVGTIADGVEVFRLLASKPGQSLLEVLQPLLERLFTPPAADDSADAWLSYLNQEHMRTSDRRVELYAQHVAMRLSERVVWESDGQVGVGSGPRPGGALAIGFDPGNQSLANALIAIYEPSRVLLLLDETAAHTGPADLRRSWPNIMFDAAVAKSWGDAAARVAAWLTAACDDGLDTSCDLTPATKMHAWSLATAAARTGAQVYAVRALPRKNTILKLDNLKLVRLA